MNDKYILDENHAPIVEPDLLTWGRWMQNANRHVARTMVGDVRVSTVFLGLDHRFTNSGEPIVFEPMIFGGPEDGYQERYSTWDAALAGHAIAVALAKSVAAFAPSEAETK